MKKGIVALLALLASFSIIGDRTASSQVRIKPPSVGFQHQKGKCLFLSLADPYIQAGVDNALNDAAAMHFSFIGEDILWAQAKTTLNGAYDWTAWDYLVPAARSKGIQIYFFVWSTPDWATTGTTGKGVPDRVANYADYADFITQVVKRYKPDGDLAQEQGWTDHYGVTYYSVWEEPNVSSFWEGTMTEYTGMMKVAYTAAHAEYPGVKILSGGLSRSVNLTTTINTMYTAGAKGFYDILALDYFANTAESFCNGGGSCINDDLGVFRTQLINRGDPNVPIWITATGWESPTGNAGLQPVPLTKQAIQYSTLYYEALPYMHKAYGIDLVCIFAWKDSASNNYGLLYTDGTHKPAYGTVGQVQE